MNKTANKKKQLELDSSGRCVNNRNVCAIKWILSQNLSYIDSFRLRHTHTKTHTVADARALNEE